MSATQPATPPQTDEAKIFVAPPSESPQDIQPVASAEPATDSAPTDLAQQVEHWKAMARKQESRAKENAEAAKRLAAIEEANKTEAEKSAERLAALQQENERLKTDALRAQVAAEKGVPADLLTGTTPEELTAAADKLLAFRGQQAPPTPAPDFGAGDRGEPAAKVKQLTSADVKRMTPDEIVAADNAGQFADLKAGRL